MPLSHSLTHSVAEGHSQFLKQELRAVRRRRPRGAALYSKFSYKSRCHLRNGDTDGLASVQVFTSRLGGLVRRVGQTVSKRSELIVRLTMTRPASFRLIHGGDF